MRHSNCVHQQTRYNRRCCGWYYVKINSSHRFDLVRSHSTLTKYKETVLTRMPNASESKSPSILAKNSMKLFCETDTPFRFRDRLLCVKKRQSEACCKTLVLSRMWYISTIALHRGRCVYTMLKPSIFPEGLHQQGQLKYYSMYIELDFQIYIATNSSTWIDRHVSTRGRHCLNLHQTRLLFFQKIIIHVVASLGVYMNNIGTRGLAQ